jgi:hypothetical protein
VVKLPSRLLLTHKLGEVSSLHLKDTKVIVLDNPSPDAVCEKLRLKEIPLTGFDTIILNLGATNLSDTASVSRILNDYCVLVRDIPRYNPSAQVVVSGIIPRPLDDHRFGHLFRKLNTKLWFFSDKAWKCPFLKVASIFTHGQSIRNQYFESNSNGLNRSGLLRLQNFIASQSSRKALQDKLSFVRRLNQSTY